MPQKIIFTDQQTQEIISLYTIDFWPCNKIGKKFGCVKGPINNLLRKNDIKLRDCSHSHRRYTVDENKFESIDTHEKAYWLGMLCGDGCVTDDGLIRLGLSVKDEDHVRKFRDFLCSNHKIYRTISKKKNGTKSYASLISIYNKKIIQDLKNLGLIPNKTETLKFPNISKEFYSSFILGMIDADGWFKINNKTSKKSGQGSVGLGATYNFLLKYQEILHYYCNLRKINKIQKTKTNFFFVLEYGGNKQFLRIIQFLYSNSPMWLDRKKDKAFNHLKKIYPNDKWVIQNCK